MSEKIDHEDTNKTVSIAFRKVLMKCQQNEAVMSYFLPIFVLDVHPSNYQNKINIFLTLITCWDLLINTLYIPCEEQFYENNQIKGERCDQLYLIICEYF